MSSSEGSRAPSEPSRTPLDDQRSVSDGDLDSERKKRRTRRRRGNRGRYKPYELVTDLEEASTSSATDLPSEKKKIRKGMPMAPRNTTQFLLEDMEERAEAEREVELAHCAEGKRRVRSLSVGSEFLAALSDGESEASSLSEADHREFETELEEFNIERISHLTRDEMTREIMEKDKEAEVYHDGLLKMNRENERLRRLLKDNGIPIEDSAKAPAGQPQAVS